MQELDNIGQSNKDPEIQDLSLTLEETSDQSERPLKTEHLACQGGLQMATVEQHPQNQPISTDCPCNTEAVTEARSLAQLCLPAPNRLLMKNCLEVQEDQGKDINYPGKVWIK